MQCTWNDNYARAAFCNYNRLVVMYKSFSSFHLMGWELSRLNFNNISHECLLWLEMNHWTLWVALGFMWITRALMITPIEEPTQSPELVLKPLAAKKSEIVCTYSYLSKTSRVPSWKAARIGMIEKQFFTDWNGCKTRFQFKNSNFMYNKIKHTYNVYN